MVGGFVMYVFWCAVVSSGGAECPPERFPAMSYPTHDATTPQNEGGGLPTPLCVPVCGFFIRRFS